MQRHKIKARKASTHSGNQPAAAILRELARQHIRVSLTVHKAQTLLTIEAHPADFCPILGRVIIQHARQIIALLQIVEITNQINPPVALAHLGEDHIAIMAAVAPGKITHVEYDSITVEHIVSRFS